MYRRWLAAVLAYGLSAPAGAKDLCSVLAEAHGGRIIVQEGDCNERVTPASTFKIAIALMGFDAGFLKSEHDPVLAYREGEPDWGGADWRMPTDPARWMAHSVFWFSQRVTRALGQDRLQHYARAFRYGNADVSGMHVPDERSGGAWVNASLRISPLEQIAFLRDVVERRLPVSAQAYEMTASITRIATLPGGWEVHGKTGTGSPGADGHYDAAHAYGWFVGWATRGGEAVVFAHLIQDDRATRPNAGLRARDAWLRRLPALLDAHAQP
jgi:beta-lactamase class D